MLKTNNVACLSLSVWCWLIGCCEVDDVEVENKEGNKKNHPEENKKEREEHNSDRDMKDFNIHEKEISGENTLNVAVDNVGR